MILVIAEFPSVRTERDGMRQRIAAVDRLLATMPRTYVHLYPRRWIVPLAPQRRTAGNVPVVTLNANFHVSVLEHLARQADLIYVHSVYNAESCLGLYKRHGDKIITDLHGIVPEELELAGEFQQAAHFRVVEQLVVEHSRFLITVTDAMSRYFISKYGTHIREKLVCLPILSEQTRPVLSAHPLNLRPRMIYAGGLQVWQKIDFALEFFRDYNVLSRYDATFLVSDPAQMKRQAKQFGFGDRLVIDSVAHTQVFEHYLRADIGVVLRDESVVNAVALPTKMIEYLEYDLVPLVKHPGIGDFPEFGYAYLTLEDIQAGAISRSRLEEMRSVNRIALEHLRAQAAVGQSTLLKVVKALVSA